MIALFMAHPDHLMKHNNLIQPGNEKSMNQY